MILRFSIPLFFVVLVSAGLADDARSTLRVGSDAVEPGKWIHVAAVKRRARLALYVDGEEKASATIPAEVYSEAANVALGGNPSFTGNEHLAASMADFALYARALSPEEIRKLVR